MQSKIRQNAQRGWTFAQKTPPNTAETALGGDMAQGTSRPFSDSCVQSYLTSGRAANDFAISSSVGM